MEIKDIGPKNGITNRGKRSSKLKTRTTRDLKGRQHGQKSDQTAQSNFNLVSTIVYQVAGFGRVPIPPEASRLSDTILKADVIGHALVFAHPSQVDPPWGIPSELLRGRSIWIPFQRPGRRRLRVLAAESNRQLGSRTAVGRTRKGGFCAVGHSILYLFLEGRKEVWLVFSQVICVQLCRGKEYLPGQSSSPSSLCTVLI